MDVEMSAVDPGPSVRPDDAEDVASHEGATASADGAGPDGVVLEVDSQTAELLEVLEGADDLPLDERLELLRRAESSIAGVLEGLDGL